MRKAILIAAACFTFIFSDCTAQNEYRELDKYSHFLIQSQNDFWKWRSPTDRYFTNSIYIEHISHRYYDRWRDGWFMFLFPKFKYEDTNNNFGFGLGQDFYTPTDISTSNILPNDRPYAGFLYLTALNVSNSFKYKSRLTSKYHLGVIGPASFSDQIQKSWHKIIDSPDPQGWGNQIKNDIGFNLNLTYEKRIIQPMENIDFIAFADMNVFSTISNNISVGVHYRVGKFNDYFTNITARKPKASIVAALEDFRCTEYCYATRKKFQFYGFVKTSITSMLDNSFLEGGVFNRGSVHIIDTDDINRFYLNGEFGLQMNYSGWYIGYSQLFRTAEFKDAKTSYWGKLEIIIPL